MAGIDIDLVAQGEDTLEPVAEELKLDSMLAGAGVPAEDDPRNPAKRAVDADKPVERSYGDPRLASLSAPERFEHMPAPGNDVSEATAFVRTKRRVDSKNVVNNSVPYTKSVCPICGADITKVNGLPQYGKLSEPMQARVDAALVQHITMRHPADTLPMVIKNENRLAAWETGNIVLGIG